MEETIKLEMSRDEAAQFQSVLESCVRELRAAGERMDRNEAERLRLQAETRAILDQLKATWHVETIG